MPLPAIALAALGFVGGAFAGTAIDYLLEPLMRLIRSLIPVQEHDVGTLTQLYRLGVLDEAEFKERLKALGYDGKKAEELIAASKWVPSISDTIRLWRLGLIDTDTRNKLLRAQGVDPEAVDLALKSTLVHPSAEDIIRFAVREVFTESVVQKYGYDADIPREYLEWAERLGLSREFAKWYWRAHWEIPPPSQAIELMQRGIIDVEDVDTVLKIHDMAPYWRPRLLALAFDPYTRVDVRRMYELGVLSEEDLIKAARAIGYAAKEDIEKLRQVIGDPNVVNRLFVGRAEDYVAWIKAEILDPWRNDVIRAVREAFGNGLIEEEKASQWLRSLGVPEHVIGSMIEFWKIKDAIDALKDAIAAEYEACTKGLITPEELRDTLQSYGVSARVIDYYVYRCRVRTAKKVKSQSVSSE